jgi:hypothetical protein
MLLNQARQSAAFQLFESLAPAAKKKYDGGEAV